MVRLDVVVGDEVFFRVGRSTVSSDAPGPGSGVDARGSASSLGFGVGLGFRVWLGLGDRLGLGFSGGLGRLRPARDAARHRHRQGTDGEEPHEDGGPEG